MAADWNDSRMTLADTPLAKDRDQAADMVRELLAAMHRRDEAQKAASESEVKIKQLVALLRDQHPQLIAMLNGQVESFR